MDYSAILDIFRGTNDSLKEKTYSQIYKNAFPPILKFVTDERGNKDDALDVFHEAWCVVLLNLEDASFKLTAKLETYMYSVAKNKWRQMQEKANKIPLLNNNKINIDFIEKIQDELSYDEAKEAKIEALEKTLYEDVRFEKCTTLLKDYYWNNLSMEQIAIKNNFANADSAKNQKSKCMKKLKHLFNF